MRNRRSSLFFRMSYAASWFALLLTWVPMVGCGALSTQTLSMKNTAIDSDGFSGLPGQQLTYDEEGNLVEATVTDQNVELPPAELRKRSLPRYRIEPPDVLIIQAIHAAPKAPYHIDTFDILQIVVAGTPPDQPIAGLFQVEPDGSVNLGPSYGHIKVQGMTMREAEDEILRQLSQIVVAAEVAVSLNQSSGQQLIAGEHLVGPDGYVNLGKFGSVYISGMTVDEATDAIEKKLAEQLDNPVISLDVFTYNSKVFYVIMEGAGFGNSIMRLPITGNETVLDALSTIGGTQRISDVNKMWIARPAPHGSDVTQILPVDYQAITKNARPGTNYQLLPGDRLYIGEDRLIAVNSLVAKIVDPVERMFGFSLLGAQTIQTLQRFPEGFRTGF